MHPFKNIIGYEIISPLHKMALKAKKRYDDSFANIFSENQELFPNHVVKNSPNIIYLKNNFFEVEWTEASVVYCNSTCFDDETTLMVYKKAMEIPSGCFLIIICNHMQDELISFWDYVEPFSRLMSWGTSEILIYRKK
jgi:hypothetical protein